MWDTEEKTKPIYNIFPHEKKKPIHLANKKRWILKKICTWKKEKIPASIYKWIVQRVSNVPSAVCGVYAILWMTKCTCCIAANQTNDTFTYQIEHCRKYLFGGLMLTYTQLCRNYILECKTFTILAYANINHNVDQRFIEQKLNSFKILLKFFSLDFRFHWDNFLIGFRLEFIIQRESHLQCTHS